MRRKHLVELTPQPGRRVITRVDVLGLAHRGIRQSEVHDNRPLTAKTAATRPAERLLCNVVPQSVVLNDQRVKGPSLRYLPVRSRCLQPGQQQGRRRPSSSSSWVRRTRRLRVASCLASSTQQMNSLRASGVMSFHAASASELPISASRKSAGSLCTTPPGTRWLLTGLLAQPNQHPRRQELTFVLALPRRWAATANPRCAPERLRAEQLVLVTERSAACADNPARGFGPLCFRQCRRHRIPCRHATGLPCS